MIEQKISIYCVLETEGVKQSYLDSSFHIIFKKDSLPEIPTYLTHTPRSAPRQGKGNHKVFFMLFQGFHINEAEEVKIRAEKMFRLIFVQPRKVAIEFIVKKPKPKPKTKNKEADNVGRIKEQKEGSQGDSPGGSETEGS